MASTSISIDSKRAFSKQMNELLFLFADCYGAVSSCSLILYGPVCTRTALLIVNCKITGLLRNTLCMLQWQYVNIITLPYNCEGAKGQQMGSKGGSRHVNTLRIVIVYACFLIEISLSLLPGY